MNHNIEQFPSIYFKLPLLPTFYSLPPSKEESGNLLLGKGSKLSPEKKRETERVKTTMGIRKTIGFFCVGFLVFPVFRCGL